MSSSGATCWRPAAATMTTPALATRRPAAPPPGHTGAGTSRRRPPRRRAAVPRSTSCASASRTSVRSTTTGGRRSTTAAASRCSTRSAPRWRARSSRTCCSIPRRRRRSSRTWRQNHDLVIANTRVRHAAARTSPPSTRTSTSSSATATRTSTTSTRTTSSTPQPTYALGVAAAMLNEGADCKIGYIGAFPTATAYNDVNGLLLGARSINPTATVQAVMISSFFDPPKATAAANALLGEDINFLFCGDGRAVVPPGRQRRRRLGRSVEHRRPPVRPRRLRQHAPARLRLVLPRAGERRARRHVDGEDRARPAAARPRAPGATTCRRRSAPRSTCSGRSCSTARSTRTPGRSWTTQGTERLEEGESLDDQQAYLIDWAVEGVSGVDG